MRGEREGEEVSVEYNSLPGMNVSKLKDAYAEGWQYFAAAHVHQTLPKRDKKEFTFGSAVHLALLKPNEFREKVITVPRELLASNGARSTKDAKEFMAANSDKIILTDGEMDACHQCLASLLAHDQVIQIMAMESTIETPISAEIDGRTWKGIPDIVTKRKFVIDLKTTGFISEKKFTWQVRDLGYHLQAAWYLELCRIYYGRDYDTFVFVAIETDPPYRCRCYYLDDDLVNEGAYEITRLLDEYDRRLAANDWLEDCDRGLIRIGGRR